MALSDDSRSITDRSYQSWIDGSERVFQQTRTAWPFSRYPQSVTVTRGGIVVFDGEWGESRIPESDIYPCDEITAIIRLQPEGKIQLITVYPNMQVNITLDRELADEFFETIAKFGGHVTVVDQLTDDAAGGTSRVFGCRQMQRDRRFRFVSLVTIVFFIWLVAEQFLVLRNPAHEMLLPLNIAVYIAISLVVFLLVVPLSHYREIVILNREGIYFRSWVTQLVAKRKQKLFYPWDELDSVVRLVYQKKIVLIMRKDGIPVFTPVGLDDQDDLFQAMQDFAPANIYFQDLSAPADTRNWKPVLLFESGDTEKLGAVFFLASGAFGASFFTEWGPILVWLPMAIAAVVVVLMVYSVLTRHRVNIFGIENADSMLIPFVSWDEVETVRRGFLGFYIVSQKPGEVRKTTFFSLKQTDQHDFEMFLQQKGIFDNISY